MKLTEIKLYKIRLRTHRPFKIAFEVLNTCEGIVIELHTDNRIVGLGEASPARRITGETATSVAHAIRSILWPSIKGCDPFQIAEIHARMNETIRGNPAAKAAIDIACHDLMGKVLNRPVVTLLGGKSRDLLTDHTISILPPKEQAEKAKQLVKDKFKILKVKLGVGEKEDLARIKAIRESVGKEVVIRVDANQGWSTRQTLSILEKLHPYSIELAEQPIAWHDKKGLAYLRARSPIPIAADESLLSPEDALHLIELNACDIFNIKLMKCGGIYPATKIATLVESANLHCMIGGMIGESRLAVTAAAHFAAARPVVKHFDLDADLLLRDDGVSKGGIGLKNGARTIADMPGFGVAGFAPQFLEAIP